MGLNKSRTTNLIQKSEFRISFSNKNNNQKNEYRRVRQSKQTIGREVNYLENLKTTNYLLRTKKTCRSLTNFRGVVSTGSTTAMRKPSTSGPTSRRPPSSVSSV